MTRLGGRNCVVSAFTSAGAFVVTTNNAALVGIVASGSAASTVVNIHKGTSTAGTKVFICPVASTAGQVYTLEFPLVCSGGITATNVGTVATYAILYTDV